MHHHLQTSSFNKVQIVWDSIDDEVKKGFDAGTLDSHTSAMAIGLNDLMQTLCDAFIKLEVHKAACVEAATDVLTDGGAWSPYDVKKPPPTPSLPPYILPSYEWLLDNLYKPYPSQRVRQELSTSTNSERRLIDAWFVDARRRIGWTALIAKARSSETLSPNVTSSDASSFLPSSGTPSESVILPRRPQNAAGPGRSELQYKTRKDLVTAATAFFRRNNPAHKGNYQLSAEEEMRFTVMKSHAESLYKRQLEPSQLALKVTGQVKRWTPELGEQANQAKVEERKRKRRTRIKAELDLEFGEEDRSESKRARLSSPSSPGQSRLSSLTLYESVSSPSNHDSSSPVNSPASSAPLKRKRTVSESQHELEQTPVFSAAKRLRTAINSSGLARSVSDPTTYARGRESTDITFSGFPASLLGSWFDTGNPADPFGSKFDPFSPLDSVEIFDSTPEQLPSVSPLALQPHPLSVDLADLSLFSTSGYGSPSTSPSTPGLSASGSLTDFSDDEESHGDDDVDSLFDDRVIHEADTSVFDLHTLVTNAAVTEAKSTSPASVLTPADILDGATNSVAAAPIPDFAPFDLSITDPSLLNFTDFGLTGFPEIDFGDSQLGLQSGFPGAIEGSYEGNLDALLSAWAPPDRTGSGGAWDVQNWTGVTQLTPTQVTFAAVQCKAHRAVLGLAKEKTRPVGQHNSSTQLTQSERQERLVVRYRTWEVSAYKKNTPFPIAKLSEIPMSEISLPETVVQLSEQALQPQSWSPMTWVFVVGFLVSTAGVWRAFRELEEAYFPCVSLTRVTKMAAEVDEALKMYRDGLTGTGHPANFGDQWEMVLDYEERLMTIQENLLDMALEKLARKSWCRQRMMMSPQRIVQQLKSIAESYRELRSLKNQIQTSNHTRQRDQIRWDLQLCRLRRTSRVSALKLSNQLTMSSLESGKIFNVAEPTGIDAVRAETTAAQAQAEAPTTAAARAVEHNAQQTTAAAETAARAARSFGREFTGEPPSVAEQLQAKTDTAVQQGKADVEMAKAEGQGYLDQAKQLAGTALATAQAYLPTNSTTASAGAQDTLAQIQTTANSALSTGKEYLASAQNAAQPHIDRAIDAAQPHIEKVSNYVSGQTGSGTAAPRAVPASSAPLESGLYTVGNPYPNANTKVGE
ncbi:hypothetical protein D9757_004639 [Collybiopsis confluens]|uniref:KN homeodomain domain-containing protein n=1 Tax=Collybiopsis confluens TaxID=2823264 RepID=A0A8H5HS70_9AGAR|nr:hypothetical protein D9757_004639 [Collybiopsis confluens]